LARAGRIPRAGPFIWRSTTFSGGATERRPAPTMRDTVVGLTFQRRAVSATVRLPLMTSSAAAARCATLSFGGRPQGALPFHRLSVEDQRRLWQSDPGGGLAGVVRVRGVQK
jgi:hypothetical protein